MNNMNNRFLKFLKRVYTLIKKDDNLFRKIYKIQKTIQIGDIILASPKTNIFNRVYHRLNWTYCSMYIGVYNFSPSVVEYDNNKVVSKEIIDFLFDKGRICILRSKELNFIELMDAVYFIKNQIGKNFWMLLLTNKQRNDKYYSSELIYLAYKFAKINMKLKIDDVIKPNDLYKAKEYFEIIRI
jgi:hypothetical protein